MARGTALSALFLLLAVALLAGARPAHARIVHTHPEDDTRSWYLVDKFGHVENGFMNLTVTHLKVKGIKDGASEPVHMGFLLRRGKTVPIEQMDETLWGEKCWFDDLNEEFDVQTLMLNPDAKEGTKFEMVYHVPKGGDDIYTVYFIKCGNHDVSVTMSVRLEQYNPPKDYLSAGESQLPTVYVVCAMLFLVELAVWLFLLKRNAQHVHKIHYLMAAMIVVKVLSLLFEAEKYHTIKVDGHTEGWGYIYYVFAIVQTTSWFVLVVLLGTGWSFVKPFLSDKDKKILLFVIPLQVIANVADVILEEHVPGDQGWSFWRATLRIVDLACCCAVVLPIVWSIRTLKEASQQDGKAAADMKKLQLFRSFYLLVISYVYFTRIVVFLLIATLNFHLAWMYYLFEEVCALAFFWITGSKFKPASHNPYLSLSTTEMAHFNTMDRDEDDEELFDA